MNHCAQKTCISLSSPARVCYRFLVLLKFFFSLYVKILLLDQVKTATLVLKPNALGSISAVYLKRRSSS